MKKTSIYALWDSISAWTWEILQTLVGLFVVLIYRAKFEKKIDINDYITNEDEDTQSIASRKINFKINANIDESEFNEMDFLN